jgi:TrmH family RNA methyltransferase
MLSKNEVKYIQSLGHKKSRGEAGVFIAEGPKIVSELLSIVPEQFQKLYAVEEWLSKNESLTKNISVTEISAIELEKVSGLKTPNEVVAVISQFKSREPEGFSVALYLDAIQDPGNFGTIIRIADWFGVKDVVCTSGCADLYNAKVVQSTMASIARVNVWYEENYGWLKKQNCTVLAATLQGEPMYKISASEKQVLVIGNESKGISDAVLQYATQQVTIPRRGEAESLNAAVATGILLSHLIK